MTLNPATLAGKVLWLRGKDLGAPGSTVASWADQSGLGNNATVTSGTPTVDASTGSPAATADSGHYGPSGPDGTAAYAFDGSATTYYTSNATQTGWIRAQYGTAFVSSSYGIRRRDDIPARNPTAWTFEGSNDGTSWTVLDTRSGITWPTSGQTQTFTFTNSTAYTYYRLNITANGGDTYLSVAELTINGTDKALSTSGAVVSIPADTVGGSTREVWIVVKAGSATGSAGENAWGFGSSGQSTVFPYSDGKIYDGAFTTSRQSFTPTMSVVNVKRLYRVVMTGGVWTAYLDGAQQASVSGLTFGLSASPKVTNGWSNGDIYEIFERTVVSTTTEVANLIDYFNTEHGLSVPGGSPPSTPTTTGGLPATTGATGAALTVGSSVAALGAAVALAASALTVGATTSSLPVTVGSSDSSSTQMLGSTAGALPASVAAISSALTITSVTGGLPAISGADSSAVTITTSTGATPTTVGMGSDAVTINQPTTGSLAATSGLESASGTVGVPSTTGTLPVTTGLTATAIAIVKPGPWTADQSQAALLDMEPVGGPLTVEPAVAPAPPNIIERTIRRQSHVAPALVPDADGHVHSDGTYTIVDDVVGVPHLFISNKDVTYFRGATVTLSEWSSTLPGGDEVAAVDFPQLTFGDIPGSGDLAWLKPDAQAEIYLIDPNGNRIQPAMFCGHLVSDNVGHTQQGMTNGWHLEGSLSQANYQGHRVPTYLNTTDIGTLIAKHLNGVISRRYAAIKPVNTGIMTMNRGSYSDSEWDYVQALLGVAWTADGHQWTVARTATPRTFKIALKDTSTVNWTLTSGAPGVEVDLTADQASVVHAIFGRGVGPDGYAWAGWVYPNLGIDNAPAYPYASASTTMSVGSTDAGTLTGRGVSDWQERARQLGYRITVDGSYSSDDATTCRAIQERYGLTIDGVVGPQTWAATFAVGSNAGSLDGAYRRPLAVLSSVEPRLTTADGGDAGPNPAYNPAIIRRELDIDYGSGVRKSDATVSAQRQLARDSQPGWAGTIKMQSDFHEGSRFLAFEGQNIKLRGFRGGDPLLHIVKTNKRLDGGMLCTFDVDSKARDAMTLESIILRDRDSKPDPTRRPGIVNRKSRMEQDMVVDFDGESGAGVIPRHALYGGLWTVIRIPVSQVGRIAKIDISTSGPAAKFAIALFGSPIQPSQLQRMVGDPLASTGPFTTHADTLDDVYGLIEGWGQKGQGAGFYPGSEGSGSLTGRMLETSTIEYVSQTPPWVWVAEYSDTSCFISGRIYPAPVA